MHPAVSIIVFSTFSGVGFGICFWLGVLGPNANAQTVIIAGFFGLVLAVIGLLSSLFHLRRPARAVRALSQWRSSWLSREGVMAIVTLSCVFLFLVGRFFNLFIDLVTILAVLMSLLSLATVYSTAMIYTQLKAIPAWHTILTPLVYIGFALLSGIAFIFSFMSSLLGDGMLLVNLVLLLGSWGIWFLWVLRSDRIGLGSSNVETATGLGKFGNITPFEPPHLGPNYLTREMGYTLPRSKSRLLRATTLTIGLVIPLLLFCFIFFSSIPWLVEVFKFLYFCSAFAGIFISRWLFFAEARHTTMLYYRKE